MKTSSMIFSVLILLASQVSFAKPVLVTGVEAKNLKTVMDLYTYDCSIYYRSDVNDQIQGAEEVYLDENGTQPVLVFVNYTADKKQRSKTSVTTDASFTKITALKYEADRLGPVNRGTIVKPRIVQDYVTRQTFSCDYFKLN